MSILRINAQDDTPLSHDVPTVPAGFLVARHLDAPGPVIVMVHGYSYRPHRRGDCPHDLIYALDPVQDAVPSWPRALGFGSGDPREGVALAFGWNARGTPQTAHRRAQVAGDALARVVEMIRTGDPARNIHVIAHSLGSEVVFAALRSARTRVFDRIILLAAASRTSRAEAAMRSDAGLAAELINVTSRENDLFDLIVEGVMPADCTTPALGRGLSLPNAVTVQLDCARTLAHLGGLGHPVAAPDRRVCHWSVYTRGGVMPFYRALLREPQALPLARLRAGLPAEAEPRWSRIFDAIRLRPPLPVMIKPS